jgi:hypothetical protein
VDIFYVYSSIRLTSNFNSLAILEIISVAVVAVKQDYAVAILLNYVVLF